MDKLHERIAEAEQTLKALISQMESSLGSFVFQGWDEADQARMKPLQELTARMQLLIDSPGVAILDRSIDELELRMRAWHVMKNHDIRTLRDLVSKSPRDLLNMKNFGRKSFYEVKDLLGSMGLRLGMDLPPEAK
jgi:DNA-directed RNA polymerase alpha subunit